jgi:lipid II:glycine glycyltransferase (peptidoglycan interpeptide bridge formation enzyme)
MEFEHNIASLAGAILDLEQEKKELIQERDYYKALAEKYEEMLENPNRNYD